MTKKISKTTTNKKSSEAKRKVTKKHVNEPANDKKTNNYLKLSVVFAGIAMLANIVIYFFAILPTYDVIDGDSVGSLSDTLDSSERVTEIFTPLVFVALAISVGFLTVGIYKYVKDKPKAGSRTDSSKNT